jgi:hypothetical protein
LRVLLSRDVGGFVVFVRCHRGSRLFLKKERDADI